MCLFGEGPNGFISLVYVGALNVGSINFTFDKDLKSNVKRSLQATNKLNVVRYDKDHAKAESNTILQDSKVLFFLSKLGGEGHSSL